MPLRLAAIDFLNPAPLMWDFDHPPLAAALAERFHIHRTTPAGCARDLHEGRADLGLIPVAALTPALRVVPGCAIASLREVRSIQLIVRAPLQLAEVRSVAADAASRSSAAYAEVIFRHFLRTQPSFHQASADPEAMLGEADAALLIGDPALHALERRAAIEATLGPCSFHDLAALWHTHTGLPWVAAVWAAQPQAVDDPAWLTAALNASRDHGLDHIDSLVAEWTPRLDLPASTIRSYLTENIYYHLDQRCCQAIQLFRKLAAEHGILPSLPDLAFLR